MDQKNITTCPIPAGVLVIIGGKEDKATEQNDQLGQRDERRLDILKHFVSLIPKEAPVIQVITSASREGAECFDDYKKVFEQLGKAQVRHLHHHNRQDLLNETSSEVV